MCGLCLQGITLHFPHLGMNFLATQHPTVSGCMQCRQRKLSACWYQYRQQREVFARWRSHSAYKAGKADKWRRAVRHRHGIAITALFLCCCIWLCMPHSNTCVCNHPLAGRCCGAFILHADWPSAQKIRGSLAAPCALQVPAPAAVGLDAVGHLPCAPGAEAQQCRSPLAAPPALPGTPGAGDVARAIPGSSKAQAGTGGSSRRPPPGTAAQAVLAGLAGSLLGSSTGKAAELAACRKLLPRQRPARRSGGVAAACSIAAGQAGKAGRAQKPAATQQVACGAARMAAGLDAACSQAAPGRPSTVWMLPHIFDIALEQPCVK